MVLFLYCIIILQKHVSDILRRQWPFLAHIQRASTAIEYFNLMDQKEKGTDEAGEGEDLERHAWSCGRETGEFMHSRSWSGGS